jgi:uncharacterized protein (DUF305 family)
MQKDSVLYGIIGLLAGGLIVGTIAVAAVNSNHTGMMKMMGMHTSSMEMSHTESSDDHMGMSMNEMSSNLENKTGNSFDKTFLSEMIDHHQGAIDMANLAKQNAKHEEIKRMSADIVEAQSKEIDQMKAWQKEWGYKN